MAHGHSGDSAPQCDSRHDRDHTKNCVDRDIDENSLSSSCHM